jgi:trimeric autotransporter adhesin
VTEVEGEEIDTVRSTVSYTLGANLENLTLTGSAAIDGTGNALNNVITGNSASNQLTGLAGNDSLNGGAGDDTLIGGAGDDAYTVDSTSDVVTELANQGTDTVRTALSYSLKGNLENLTLTGAASINATGNSANNTITGNSANNTLNGGAGSDIIVGGAGDDGLIGGQSDDSMSGGQGDDTYFIDSNTDSITELANQGTDTVRTALSYNLKTNLENLTLTGAADVNGTGNNANNTLTGNSGSNIFSGGAGNDTIASGAGNDSLLGGTGDDNLKGGQGNDLYQVDSIADRVTELGNQGTDTVQSSINYSLGANLDNLTLTGAADINGSGNSISNTLTGNSGSNTLNGGGGDDTIVGGSGNDSLNGGLGNDNMSGGSGNDTYFIENNGDAITEGANAGTDTVRSTVSYNLGANVENLTFTGNVAINGTGNGLNNVITGNSAANILSGGAGNDTIVGGAGDDILLGELGDDSMSGGLGNDTYSVDSLADLVRELAGQGIDTVQASVNHILSTNVENLTLTGSDDISATGNSLSNSLIGNEGNNVLSGRAGNDVMTGGGGVDQFLFSSGAAFTAVTMGSDSITDFTGGSDKLVLSKATFAALNSVIGSGFSDATEFAVVTTDAAARTSTAKIVYNSDSGSLFYNQNGVSGGLGTGSNFAVLSTKPVLSASDFVLQA